MIILPSFSGDGSKKPLFQDQDPYETTRMTHGKYPAGSLFCGSFREILREGPCHPAIWFTPNSPSSDTLVRTEFGWDGR